VPSAGVHESLDMARFQPKAVDEWVLLNLAKFDPFFKGSTEAPPVPPVPEAKPLDAHKTARDLGYEDPVYKARPKP
jgi:hypothetical protein